MSLVGDIPGITFVIPDARGSADIENSRISWGRGMFNVSDQVYYDRRAEHATELGNQATDPKIAAIHFELALRYSIAAVQSPRPRPDVRAASQEGRIRRPYVSLEPVPEYALR